MEFRGYLVDYGESVGDSSVPSDSDRKFLIDFIYTTYLGPDIKHYNTGCSVRERVIGGSPPYSLSDLAPSFLPIAFLEGMYYHVLRYSSRELVLDPHMLRMYLQGKLFLPSSDFTPDSPQFTSFFPLDLHEQKWDPNLFRIVRGLVFIDDPATAYIEEEDLNRFKSLTRVTTLKLNSSDWADYEDDDYSVNIEPENSQNEEGESGKFQQRHKGKNVDDTLPMPEFRSMFPTKHNVKLHPSKNTCKSDGPTYMPLLSVPDIGFWSQNCSTVFKGSARNGILCPPLGTVDIGIGEAAYVFRVSLVGVHKHLGKFYYSYLFLEIS